MQGTLNASLSSNNAAYARIKSLEKKLEALTSEVNVDSSQIETIQQEIAKYKAAFKANYMEEDSLKEFASRISQFGNEYIQYCFCTQRAIDELIKE